MTFLIGHIPSSKGVRSEEQNDELPDECRFTVGKFALITNIILSPWILTMLVPPYAF